MSDSHVEVESVSFFGQLRQAIGGVVTGFALIPIACCALLWNECRSAERYEALAEGKGAVVSIEGDKADKNNNNKLVHFSADATVDEELTDKKFDVTVKAIKLVRDTEIYQWKETKKEEKKGDKKKTTYTYDKEWVDKPIKSSSFKKKKGHTNVSDAFIEDESFQAKKVQAGAFNLTDKFISQFSADEKLEMNKELIATIKKKFDNAKENGDYLYLGEDPSDPAIGDVRVTFKVANPKLVSVVGQQVGKDILPHKTSNDGTIADLRAGKMTADEMFSAMESENTILTWIIRIVGFFFIFFGLMAIFRPLTVVSDRIPLIGGVISSSVALFSGVVAFGLALGFISIGWIIARPEVGIGLCVCSLVFFGLLIGLGVTVFKATRKED